MANQTVYPYGTGGELPSSIGIINDLTTGGVNKALSAEMGKTLNGNLTQLGQKVTPFPYFLDGSVEANKRVKELYLVGLDNTKRYYFKLLRYYSSGPYVQARIYSFTLADHSDEVEVARTSDAAPMKGVAVISERNSSGVSGYVVYDFDTTDTVNLTPEINVGVCSSLQLSPTIYAHIKKINTNDIADGAVTYEKLSAGSVGSSNIRNKNVTTESLADDAVTSEKLSAEVRRNINSLNVQIEHLEGYTGTAKIPFSVVANTTFPSRKLIVPIKVSSGVTFKVRFDGDATKVSKISALYCINENNDGPTIGYDYNLNTDYSFTAPENIIGITFLINAGRILSDAELSISVYVKSEIEDIKEEQVAQNGNIARIDNVQNLDDFGALDFSFPVESGKVVDPAKVGFDVKVVRGSELVFSYLYTNGVYSGNESLYVYFRYEDGTASSSNRIYTDGRINKFTVPKDVKRITVYVPTQALADGIITLNVVQDYNANYGNPKLLIPDYFFANNYLGNKISRIESLIIKCAGVADVFAFTTDEHWQRNAKHSPAIIKYLAEHINFDKYISGGDSTHYWNDDSAIEYNRIRKKAFKGKFLPTVGNHEYYVSYFTQSGKYDAPALYNRTAYAYFMGVDNFVGNILRGYYYFDDVERKIRYITLSAFKEGQQVDHGNYYSIGAVLGYEQEQLDWLENVALNVEQGWNIIIVTHSITGFSHDDDVLVPDIPVAVKPVCEILLRYDGNGAIMAVMAGHTHRDGIVLLNDAFVGITQNPTGKTIPVIYTNCDAYNFDDLPGEALENRDLGTITEQCFDIDIADYGAKKIHLVRIGATADLDFHKSGTLQERIMNYEQKTVSVNGTITLVSGLSGSVTWSSKNTGIATVDSSGVVTGISVGSVFITAIDSTNSISSTFIVKVTA